MKLLYFIVLTGLCMACHQPRVYRINGSLPGALDGYVVKLYNIDTYPDVLLDSTVIKDEKFQLEGTRTFEYPKYCRLVVDMTPDEPNHRKKQAGVMGSSESPQQDRQSGAKYTKTVKEKSASKPPKTNL